MKCGAGTLLNSFARMQNFVKSGFDMKILIYTNCLEGHNLEYIHHIYVGASKENDKFFLFLIPEEFKKKKIMMEWPEANNIFFDFISQEQTEKCNRNKYFHFLGTQTYSARLLARKIKQHEPDHVFMDIDQGIPYLDLFLGCNQKTRISCICYRIIPYEWKTLPLIKKIIEWLTYHVILKRSRYQTVFLLNNRKYLDLYNNKFHTDKYRYLTDPVTTDVNLGKNLREEFNIPPSSKVFIHLGVMGRHKGTLNILDAIRMLSDDESKDLYFIFAGKIGDEMKDEFYEKYNALKSYRNILVYDKFCKYEFFSSLYKTCDYVLFPYTPRPNSSGLLGNAALYGKPVITTDGGAMGDIVREYHLGYLMPNNSSFSIYNAIREPYIANFCPSQYVMDHTINNFCNQIFEIFK